MVLILLWKNLQNGIKKIIKDTDKIQFVKEIIMELNNESKTLFIPLLGKAVMSRDNLFLHDPKAEVIISKNNYDFSYFRKVDDGTENEIFNDIESKIDMIKN